MAQDFRTIKIKHTTLERIRELARNRNTTPPRMLDEMVAAYELLNIQSVSYLPHPPDGLPVPLVTVSHE